MSHLRKKQDLQLKIDQTHVDIDGISSQERRSRWAAERLEQQACEAASASRRTGWVCHGEIFRNGFAALISSHISNKALHSLVAFPYCRALQSPLRVFSYRRWAPPLSLQEAVPWEEVFLGLPPS